MTGAASGIGACVASEFEARGATVIGLDIQPPLSTGTSVDQCDVADPASVERTIDQILDRHQHVDVLVNAAGIHRPGTILETTPGEWDEVMSANLRGTYLASRAVLPAMARQGRGAIVHIASVAGLVGGAGSAAYVASKGGVIALTKAMAVDHAPQGIRVNCVCPGMTETPMLATAGAGVDDADHKRRLSERLGRHPIGRLGMPVDIAAAVIYLASADAGWVTGTVLTVDGGYTVRS